MDIDDAIAQVTDWLELTEWRALPTEPVFTLRYVDRGFGFPQTVNDQPAAWHIQAWHLEVEVAVARDPAGEAVRRVADALFAAVGADQSLGGRVREAWIPIDDISREVTPVTTRDGSSQCVIPLLLADIEEGPA